MHEGRNPGNEFNPDDDFDQVFEHSVPSRQVSFIYNDQPLTMTPANTSVRLFGDGQREYSRVIVDMGDEETAHVKLDDDTLAFLANCGFPVQRPEQPDNMDEAFIAEFLRQSADDLQDGAPGLL